MSKRLDLSEPGLGAMAEMFPQAFGDAARSSKRHDGGGRGGGRGGGHRGGRGGQRVSHNAGPPRGGSHRGPGNGNGSGSSAPPPSRLRSDDSAVPRNRPSADLKPSSSPSDVPQASSSLSRPPLTGPPARSISPQRTGSGPAVSPSQSVAARSITESDGGASDSDSDSDEDGTAQLDAVPSSHAVLSNHTKMATALALDPSGGSMVTGGNDCIVNLWRFASMKADLQPTEQIVQPAEGNPIVSLAWSARGALFSIVSTAWYAKVYAADGSEQQTFAKGDPYLRDQRHTQGHVAGLVAGVWHPQDESQLATAALDATVRLWHPERRAATATVAVRAANPAARLGLTCLSYLGRTGARLAVGGSDGLVRIYPTGGPYFRPTATIALAGAAGGASAMRPSALAACVDDVSLAVRCASAGAVLLFDLRRADRPVATWADLPSRSDAANVAFSPNRRFLVCGGTAPAGRGCLHVLDVATGGRTHPDVVLPTDAGAAATAANDEVVHVAWHRTTHQLFASTASGAVHAFYHDDDAVPRRGLRCALAKLPAFTRRQDAVVHIDERQAYPIIAPYASRDVNDPTQRPAGGAKRGLHAEDTSAARVGPAPPEATRQGRGQDGHVAEGQLQRTLRQLGQNPEADEAWKMDPREAILRHAADAERDPRWVTPAYAKNQPTPILAADSSSDEEGHRPPAAKQQRLA